MKEEFQTIPVDAYRVQPGTVVDPSAWRPGDTGDVETKKQGRKLLRGLVAEMDRLQHLLWADGGHKLLVVLQAMDTGGKDGTIRKVLGGLNPQGVRVTGFKVPTPRERAHDYLWRVHQHTPGAGEIAVFNRSHYEDVLVVRVLGLAPPERWGRRYDHINDFERLLADEGTTILKFFLNISKEEQRSRLQARLDNPDKRWKFSAGDLDHRELWDDYTAAYATAIERTSTEHAPWFVVPADNKWYRDLVVASAIVEALGAMDLAYPQPESGLDGIRID
jgi:PPK2 family polyphosphate:nucleotide phosphotransferase